MLVFSAVAALALSAPGSSAADLCALAGPVVNGRACAASDYGIVISDDLPRARELLSHADSGAKRFQARFKQQPGRFVVIDTNDGKVVGDAFADLKKAGFVAVLPWLSPAGHRAQIEASLRRAIEAQMAGAPSEARESAVQQAIAQIANKPTPAGQEAGAIPHELGHIWYAEAFWPGHSAAGGHYGAPGPDWMDETAAVLMESDAFTKGRIQQFGERYVKLRANNHLADPTANTLVDLPRFFASNHPGVARGQAMLSELKKEPGTLPQNGIVIRASSGPEAEKFAETAILYYLQSTMLAEYLAERTGDPAVFARIGAAFGRGQTIEEWLASPEGKGRLPATVAALQADWLSWLELRFPAQEAATAN